MVAIEEEGHSMEVQFQITLEWKENRATYGNLKMESYLNALSMEDINKLWLPLVVYTNTDQQKTTRLGENWEWSTNVLVKREGQFGFEVLDGPRSSKEVRTASQCIHSCTHQFQCTVYQLENYSLDNPGVKMKITMSVMMTTYFPSLLF